jgi:hypothetical protein
MIVPSTLVGGGLYTTNGSFVFSSFRFAAK